MSKFALSMLLMLTAISVSWIMAAPRGGFHPEAMPCEGCHLAGKDVTQEQAHLLTAPQETLCGNCHAKANQVSHPSGFAPKDKLPANYPADWKGDLTCSTCHDVHGKTPKLMRGTKRGKELCLSCHDTKFFSRMKDNGASVTVSGHLDASMSAVTVSLDTYSIQCMDCHDDKGDAPNIDRNMIVRHGSGAMSHPITTRYEDVARTGGYRPINLLSKRIFLPNGRLSCVSCHDGYSKMHGSLVTTIAGSALCFECHDL